MVCFPFVRILQKSYTKYIILHCHLLTKVYVGIHGVNLETVLIKKMKLDGRTQKQILLNTKSLCPNYVWFRDRNELLWAKHWTKLQCINVKILAIGKKSC